MKWVTREKARVDRIACPWLISPFIDRDAIFRFVPRDQVMAVAEREGAIPCDVPGVELSHHGDRCSFDAFLDKYKLATGFQAIARDDHDNMARQFPAYDALYASCRASVGAR